MIICECKGTSAVQTEQVLALLVQSVLYKVYEAHASPSPCLRSHICVSYFCLQPGILSWLPVLEI
jgi:hypothetical protein